jgi:glutathione S-transferase
MALTLYTNPWSRGRVARWMLEEVGAPYEVRVLRYGPEMKSAAYRAINPMGKVPALVHDGVVVTENAAICAYLADAFPDAGLAPPPRERAAYYRWLFFGAGPLEAAMVNRALGVVATAEQERIVGYGTLAAVVDTLDAHLSAHPFLAGERFTAADVFTGASIAWNVEFGTLERRPSFVDYAARLTGREAWRRASALDDADRARLEETA